jgi:hypothetical protein
MRQHMVGEPVAERIEAGGLVHRPPLWHKATRREIPSAALDLSTDSP